MRILLDTHCLLWWLDDAPELGTVGRELIADPQNLIFVSVASFWELRIKEGIGKIELPSNFLEAVREQSFEMLPIGVEHTERLCGLPLHHRDPFDRLIIAQAMDEGLTVLSHDRAIALYDVEHILI